MGRGPLQSGWPAIGPPLGSAAMGPLAMGISAEAPVSMLDIAVPRNLVQKQPEPAAGAASNRTAKCLYEPQHHLSSTLAE